MTQLSRNKDEITASCMLLTVFMLTFFSKFVK
jgi:hypothetical protein